MKIPKIYADALESNIKLKGIVYDTIGRYEEVLSKSKFDFFEEYTDHGIGHVESVLQATVDIVPEDSFRYFLDAENIAALVLAVVLHDLGMHQTYESFLSLLNQSKIIIPEIDKLSWRELWDAYTEEAKKFNSQQKKEILGDYDYVIDIPKFQSQGELDGRRKKLIGEFLRRNHARIAHENFSYGFRCRRKYYCIHP
jgi:molecular chaperone HtpG